MLSDALNHHADTVNPGAVGQSYFVLFANQCPESQLLCHRVSPVSFRKRTSVYESNNSASNRVMALWHLT